jgi:hypothetical protein
VVEGGGEPLSIPLGEDSEEPIVFHPWFAMRGTRVAGAAVAFTTSPDWLTDQGKLNLVVTGDDASIAAGIAEDRSSRDAKNTDADSEDEVERVLDLCAGEGTMAAMAARFGFDACSVELSIVPHLIDRLLHEFAVSMAAASVDTEGPDSWRGLAAEVESFADAVWSGAKERLNELFEEDVDFRVWVRIIGCKICGEPVPVLSNARLSLDVALNVAPDPGSGGEGEFPRFSLLRTDFPDYTGTIAKGFCTCPSCDNRFHFQGHDLISLRSVPVAVRMRGNITLSEVDSPGGYIRQVATASHNSLAATSRRLGDRIVLADDQPMFPDSRGKPIIAGTALLPRQRAYFAALAESMHHESALLTRRSALTDEHRLAVRSAVALLISGQADYVNTYFHSFIDNPNPSTHAGPLTVAGLFTEVGGYWLDRHWRNRLRYLLRLLQENSTAPRPVKVIRADAAKIPLGDSAVSAIIWDPPYYDKINYDTADQHYRAILDAVVPDIVRDSDAQVIPLPPEQAEREPDLLLRQAREARRVVTASGSIGVFWLARKPDELQQFLDRIAPAGLRLLRAARLDTIRSQRIGAPGPQTYLLVLQPVPVAASAVVVDAEVVLALAKNGALSLYDGLADLLLSAWEPDELDQQIPAEFRGSSRQRLAGFLTSHPEPARLLADLGKPTLIRELVKREAAREDLPSDNIQGLAQQLLAKLGFAVARPVRFSIREDLHECEKVQATLQLADSMENVRGAFLTGCSCIERILRYASFAWSYLGYHDTWQEVIEQVIRSATTTRSYAGIDKLYLGQYELLFTKLPTMLANCDQEFERDFFGKISRAIKRMKAHEKLSALVALRNKVEHDKIDIASLSLDQLRTKCTTVFAEASMILADLDRQSFLPLTVRPVEERRYRYGYRVLKMLTSDNKPIEVYVGSETDLTEPLIYFGSDRGRRDLDPKFFLAAIVDDLLGLTD